VIRVSSRECLLEDVGSGRMSEGGVGNHCILQEEHSIEFAQFEEVADF